MLTKKRYLWIVVVFFTSFGVGIAHAELYNVALGGTATQSSILNDSEAVRAIDDNIDGDWWNGSVTHTWNDNPSWWEVDLGDEYPIDEIILWNRTDGCSDRLSNFTVSVRNALGTEVWSDDFFTDGGFPNPSMTIDLFGVSEEITGRYVKIQLNDVEYLSLAEVQVWSSVPEPTSLLLLMAGGGILLRKRTKTTLQHS